MFRNPCKASYLSPLKLISKVRKIAGYPSIHASTKPTPRAPIKKRPFPFTQLPPPRKRYNPLDEQKSTRQRSGAYTSRAHQAERAALRHLGIYKSHTRILREADEHPLDRPKPFEVLSAHARYHCQTARNTTPQDKVFFEEMAKLDDQRTISNGLAAQRDLMLRAEEAKAFSDEGRAERYRIKELKKKEAKEKLKQERLVQEEFEKKRRQREFDIENWKRQQDLEFEEKKRKDAAALEEKRRKAKEELEENVRKNQAWMEEKARRMAEQVKLREQMGERFRRMAEQAELTKKMEEATRKEKLYRSKWQNPQQGKWKVPGAGRDSREQEWHQERLRRERIDRQARERAKAEAQAAPNPWAQQVPDFPPSYRIPDPQGGFQQQPQGNFFQHNFHQQNAQFQPQPPYQQSQGNFYQNNFYQEIPQFRSQPPPSQPQPHAQLPPTQPLFEAQPPPPPPPVVPAAQYFNLYDAKWQEIKTGNPSSIYFGEFPWPVLCEVAGVQDITPERVKEFIFHADRPGFENKSPRDRVRPEIMHWHPDKFESKVLPMIISEHRELVKEAAGLVARFLTQLG